MAQLIDITEPPTGPITLWADIRLHNAAKAVLEGRKKAKLKGPRSLSQLWSKACLDLVKKDGRKYRVAVPAHLNK